MSETTPDPTQAALAELLRQIQAQASSAQPAGWSKPADSLPIAGVAVPIKVTTPKGEIRCYLSLGPEAITSPDAFMAALERLDAMGFPLDTWQPRESGWSGGSGSRGSWNRDNRGGGWRR